MQLDCNLNIKVFIYKNNYLTQEDSKMAEEKKDNFLLIVGVMAAISIAGVILLKSRETEHLKQSGPTDIKKEAQVLSQTKDLNNDLTKLLEQ
jgi:hypothetical protein